MCKGLESLSVTCLERAKVLKSLFGSFLHRPESSVMGHSQKNENMWLKVDEPVKWRESFDNLLSSQNGQSLFRAFLVSEFSEENLAFYLACEDYKGTKTSKLSAKAKKIYDKFICTDAPREVNLDHETRSITKTNLEHPTQSCFNLAQEKIHILMEKDCYPRFLKSPAYLELTRQVKTG